MDTNPDFDKLVENLSFQVVAGPCKKNIVDNIPKNSIGTPINVRIKYRHKGYGRKGVISVPKLRHSKSPENLRLVNSDQTIMSFNVLMDTETSKEPMKKTQKKVFNIFKPGICLSTQNNDDEHPYMPDSFQNSKGNVDKRIFSLKKHNVIQQPLDETMRPQKLFLGKCKQGGCLDPPFGEDKYAYQPALLNCNNEKDLDKNVQQLIGNSFPGLNEASRCLPPAFNIENESYKEPLITYPSNLSCSDPKVCKKTFNRSHNNEEANTSPDSNAYFHSYYIPNRSKENSVSSDYRVIEKMMNIESEVLEQYKSNKFVSPSQDSVFTPTGCPVQPILPTSINLSPIDSNVTSLPKNIEHSLVEEQNYEYVDENMGKEINISSFDYVFDSVQEPKLSENFERNISLFEKKLSQSDYVDTEISPKNMVAGTATLLKNERIAHITTNSQNNSSIIRQLLQGEDESSFKHLGEICDDDQNNYIHNLINEERQCFENPSINIIENMKDLQVMQQEAIDSLDFEKENMNSAHSLFTTHATDVFNSDIDNGSQRGHNFNISTVNYGKESLKYVLRKISTKEHVNQIITTPVPNDTSVKEESSANVKSGASDRYLRKDRTAVEKSELNYLNIGQENTNLQFTDDNLDPSDVFQEVSSPEVTLDTQSAKKSTPTLPTRAFESENNFTTNIENNTETQKSDKVTDNANIINNSINITSLEITSSKLSHLTNQEFIQLKKEQDSIDYSFNKIPELKKSLETLNNNIRDKYVSEINTKPTADIKSNNDEFPKKDEISVKSISSQRYLNLNDENEKSTVKNKSIEPKQNSILLDDRSKAVLRELEELPNKEYDVLNNMDTFKTVNNDTVLKAQNKRNNDRNETHSSPKEDAYIIINAGEITTNDNLELSRAVDDVLSEDLFYFDFAMQMSLNKNNEKVLKTIDSLVPPTNNESRALLKSYLRINNGDIKIPIDSNTNIVFRVVRDTDNNREEFKSNLLQDRNRDHMSAKMATMATAQLSDVLQETISAVYEHSLIPIENMLKALKEDVEVLIRNQILIRETLKAYRSKPTRLVHPNRRCACYRL